MARIFTTEISDSQCIGDSLDTINNSYLSLDNECQRLGTNVDSISAYTKTIQPALTATGVDLRATNNLTVTNNLSVGGNILQRPIVSYTGTATVTTVGSDTVLTFTGNGTFTVTNALGLNARVLVVGGGGGGGGYAHGGGGGGGQVIDTRTVLPSGTISITVGSGGAGGAGNYQVGVTGNSSNLGSIFALGGGGGGSWDDNSSQAKFGRTGASTGGNSGYETSRRSFYPLAGFVGGLGATYGGGGGGGAGGAGVTSGTASNGGAGGDGLASDITGSSIFYGAGGGGGAWNGLGGAGGSSGRGGTGGSASPAANPTAGQANSGSGGGGYHGAVGGQPGAAGGSGVVIIRYRL